MRALALALGLIATLATACASGRYYPPPPPAPPAEAESAPPPVEPPPPVVEAPPPQPSQAEETLDVREVEGPIVVIAWAEPRHLPQGGGQTQILVRVQKRGGALVPGVEVRLRSSEGTLFSGGRILVTDARGMTRDRLTTRQTATITLNAGGTRQSLEVLVGGVPQP